MPYKPVEIDHRQFNPGRPKKYTPQFIRKEARALLKYAKTTPLPFEFEFAPSRGYYSAKLSEWANENEIFYKALKEFKDIQTKRLVEAGLNKTKDVTMVIFTLKNVAGWRDKNEVSGYLESNETEAEKSERRKKMRDYLQGFLDPPPEKVVNSDVKDATKQQQME